MRRTPRLGPRMSEPRPKQSALVPLASAAFCVVIVGLVALACPTLANSLATQGSIRGQIIRSGDSSPVANVVVTLNETGSRTRSTMEGLFFFQELKPGTYTISAERKGYDTVRVGDVYVRAGHQTRIRIELQRSTPQNATTEAPSRDSVRRLIHKIRTSLKHRGISTRSLSAPRIPLGCFISNTPSFGLSWLI